MHLRGTVAAAGKTIAEAEERPLGLADEARECLDLLDRHARDFRSPFRRTRRQMRFQFIGAIGVAIHIRPVGVALAEQHVHDAAGEGTVGAGPKQDLDIRLLHGVIVVDVDRRNFRAPLFTGARRMRHHVDLRVYRIGAPDHDEIRDAHLARIDAGDLAGADRKADARNVGADGRVETRISLHMRKAIDAVAHHEPHGAGVIIRPYGFGAEFTLRLIETRGDFIERFIPGNPRELARTLWSGTAHRMEQPVRVMNALGVARDLRAYHAGGIGLQLGAADATDRAAVDYLDVERAGRRTIVRTGGVADIDLGMLVHALLGNIKRRGRREGLTGSAPAKTAVSHASGAQIGAATGVDGLPVDIPRAGPA